MADTYVPTDLGAQIQGLLSQLQPSPEMVNAANKRAQLEFFLGLLGAPKGGEFQRLGQSGLLALQDRDNYIKTQQALAQQNLQLAMPLLQMSMAQRASQNMQAMLNGGEGQPSELPAGAVGGSGMGGGTGATFGPSSQPGPVSGAGNPNAPDLYTRLTNYNLAQLPISGKDYSAAIKARFPEPVAMRPGAFGVMPSGQRVFNPAMPPGFVPVDPNDPMKGIQPIPGFQGAQLTNAAVPEAAAAAYKPQTGVIPGGGQGVVGTSLSAMFGGGPLPFLSGVSTGAQARPSPGASTASAIPASPGPVQTKLSPEQEKNSAALGEDLAGYRDQVAKSSTALAQLDEVSSALQYFKPGPTLPMRAKIAGYAQEIPGVGRTIADQLVPNSAAALPAIAAMDKIAVGLTAEQSKVFGSREGQQVIGMIRSAMPNAEMVPGAPQIIVDAMKGLHKWSIDKGVAAQAWVQDPAHHGSLNGFSPAWDIAHPVSSYIGTLPALAAIAKGMPPTAVDQPQAQPQQAPSGARTIVRTGTLNGRRVVQYSDGTTAFAQ